MARPQGIKKNKDEDSGKMPVSIAIVEKLWKKALELLEGECPALAEGKECGWCEGR